jgi:hypothetical protein
MKQGRATHDGKAGGKVEPKSRAVPPGYPDLLGNMRGNHVTGDGPVAQNMVPMYSKPGYMAPMAGTTRHPTGSQGKHK